VRDTGDVDRSERAQRTDDACRAARCTERRRQHARHDIRKRGDDTSARQNVAYPKPGAGDVSDERPERNLDVAICAAAGRDTASALGEADGNRANRQAATEDREWCVYAKVGSKCRR